MTTQVQAQAEENPFTKMASEDKKFELCKCNGKLHGYVTFAGKRVLPATIISLRAGQRILEFFLEEKMVTPEEKDAIFEQMKAAGLPDEIDIDMMVLEQGVVASLNPIQALMVAVALADEIEDPDEDDLFGGDSDIDALSGVETRDGSPELKQE